MNKNLNKKLFLKLLQEVYQSGTKFPEINAQDEWYLDIIYSAECISSSELASLTGVTKSAITPVTKKLERDGYITKVRSENDRRTYLLCVTEETASRYRKMELHGKNMIENSSVLTESEQKELRRLVKKIMKTKKEHL